MPTASPSLLEESKLMLKGLLELAADHIDWAPKGKHNGCDLEEASVSFLPIKAFRISQKIPCSLSAFMHVLRDEHCIRKYDPDIDEMKVLCEMKEGTVLYTAYRAPARFVAPRDFCVLTRSLTLDGRTAMRLGVGPRPLRDGDVVFVNNSVSFDYYGCPAYSKYTRGNIYVFGYVAWEISSSCPPVLQVHNYCCVDAGGNLPQWITNAAIGATCAKLDRIRELAVGLPTSLLDVLSSTLGNIGDEHPQEDDDDGFGVSTDDQPPPQASSTQIYAPVDVSLPAAPAAAAELTNSDDETSANLYSAVSDSGDSVRFDGQSFTLSHAADHDGVGSGASTNGSPNNNKNATPSLQSFGSEDSPVPCPSPQPQFGGRGVARRSRSANTAASMWSVQREEAIASLDIAADSNARRIVCLLGALSRAPGWSLVRELDTCAAEVLHKLPASASSRLLLRGESGPLERITVRVTTLMDASIEDVKDALHSTSLAPSIDPEIMRMYNEGASFHSHHQGNNNKDMQRWHVRHHVYDKDSQSAGAKPWDMVVRCTGVTLSQEAGATLGFYTPNMPAASHACVGEDAGGQVVRDPHHVHDRVTVHAFGWVVVAVPPRARSVRVSHYLLVDVPKKRSPNDFINNLLLRVRRLRHAVARASILPVHTEPLLALLAGVHTRYMTGRLSSCSVRDSLLGATCTCQCTPLNPICITIEVSFPCTLSAFADHIMRSRHAARSADVHMVSYKNYPSPPHTSIYHVQMDETCCVSPGMEYCVLETDGYFNDNDMFIVACVNCEVPSGNASSSSSRFTRGVVYHDGYVAQKKTADGNSIVVVRHFSADLPQHVVSAVQAHPIHNVAMEELVLSFLQLRDSICEL